MLAVTLGYTAHGNTAEPVTLYAGRNANLAEKFFTTPPDGIVRTELIKNPVITRRRTIPLAEAPAPVIPIPAPAEAPKPKPAKPKDLLPEAND